VTFERVLGDPRLPRLFLVEGGALAVENALKAAFDYQQRHNAANGRDGRLPVGGPDSNFVLGDGPRLRAASVFASMWQGFARRSPVFPVGRLAQQLASESRLSKAEIAAYNAPSPSDRYKA
jgi:hypothetical protein